MSEERSWLGEDWASQIQGRAQIKPSIGLPPPRSNGWECFKSLLKHCILHFLGYSRFERKSWKFPHLILYHERENKEKTVLARNPTRKDGETTLKVCKPYYGRLWQVRIPSYPPIFSPFFSFLFAFVFNFHKPEFALRPLLFRRWDQTRYAQILHSSSRTLTTSVAAHAWSHNLCSLSLSFNDSLIYLRTLKISLLLSYWFSCFSILISDFLADFLDW